LLKSCIKIVRLINAQQPLQIDQCHMVDHV
jgi:hypothetical protein